LKWLKRGTINYRETALYFLTANDLPLAYKTSGFLEGEKLSGGVISRIGIHLADSEWKLLMSKEVSI
jgi:hypothetical protein